MPDFDPFSPFVAEDGLEYADLASFVASTPVDCPRNDVLRTLLRHPSVQQSADFDRGAWIAAQYCYQNRAGDSRAYSQEFSRPARPQLWDRHAPGFPNHRRAEGAGLPDPGPAPAAAVRAAGEPEVPSGLGA